jgi:GxxExxY protein
MGYILEDETYQIIGLCMDVHNHLGPGFLEIVYKDALEYEFRKAGIEFEREREYVVNYKDVVLPHHFFADFVLLGQIILEIKAQKGIANEHFAQAINYLKVSRNPLALLVNFGEGKLMYRRLIL